MLGRDVMRRADDAVGLTRTELDVTDAAAVERAVLDARPEVVVNCAAYTNVDGAESEEDAATRVNGDGAGNVAAAAAAAGALVVYPSTDYVFDGSKREPYVESDGVGPRTAYGRSKLAGEWTTAEANSEHAIVRTSWLFGAGGRNFVETMLGLEGDLKVVADQVGCPTYTGHLAEALLTIAERRLTGIHHAAGRGACSWFDLALATFEATGTRVRVTPVTTEAFPRPAARPAWSVLGSERPDAVRLPDWREGLRAHLTTTATEVPA